MLYALSGSRLNRQQSGFTLIELVMVIVVLGILSAFAIPRFADLRSEARIAVLEGALASVRSAAAIAHAKALVSPTPISNGSTVDLEGANILIHNEYPDATSDGIIAAAQVSTDDFTVTSVNQNVIRIGVLNVSNCRFDYRRVTAAGSAPTFINLVTTGC